MDFQKLDLLICQKKLKIGVIGFGYVGMPLGIEFAKKGFKVTAFETDKEKIKKINNG
ncbi:MAG: NAD(P)-binding domain-containing protein, partial [Elusimicrobiota bacterium]